jgi:hypothetical protein
MTSNLPQREAVARIKEQIASLIREDASIDIHFDITNADHMADDIMALVSSLQDRWRPIETHDGSNKPVFICSGENVGEAYFRSLDDEDDGWWWANTTWGDYPYPDRPQPSLWMPLPPIPSSLKGSDVGEVGE